jgi:hypothetical protein
MGYIPVWPWTLRPTMKMDGHGISMTLDSASVQGTDYVQIDR